MVSWSVQRTENCELTRVQTLQSSNLIEFQTFYSQKYRCYIMTAAVPFLWTASKSS